MSGLATGWLSPMGELHECDSYSHYENARGIVDSYNYPTLNGATLNRRSADDTLMEHGWVYIGISSFLFHGWRIRWDKFLTPYQINFLRPYFDEEESELPVDAMSRKRWDDEVEEV